MRRPLVTEHNAAATLTVTLPFTLHQHLNAVHQHCDLAFLTRNHIGQLIGCLQLLGCLFFQGLDTDLAHKVRLTRRSVLCNSRVPVAPCGLGR